MKASWNLLYAKRFAFILVLVIFIYIARNVSYLVSEFVLRSRVYSVHMCKDRVQANVKIPEYIHQIYFPIKNPNLSSRNRKKMQTWKDFNPSLIHMLWNESAVINLIQIDHPKLLPLYHSYGHWVQRIDVAKYVILYHYGGWYIDLDISCKKSIGSLAQDMMRMNKSVVVHAEDTVGPATDFFGVTPQHPFIKFVLDGLPYSNKWFLFQHLTIMFSTGPSFLWGRYLNYPCTEEIHVLSLSNFATYALLSHDCSWWGKDTRFIYYALDHKLLLLTIVVSIFLIIIVLCITKRFIYKCIKIRHSR